MEYISKNCFNLSYIYYYVIIIIITSSEYSMIIIKFAKVQIILNLSNANIPPIIGISLKVIINLLNFIKKQLNPKLNFC